MDSDYFALSSGSAGGRDTGYNRGGRGRGRGFRGRGNRRGGGRGRGFANRGGYGNGSTPQGSNDDTIRDDEQGCSESCDIESYIHPDMMKNPWRQLEDKLGIPSDVIIEECSDKPEQVDDQSPMPEQPINQQDIPDPKTNEQSQS